MPLNIGRYQQGSKDTQPDTQPDEAGTPVIAGPAGPTPKSDQHLQEGTKSVGGNRTSIR